MQAYKFLGLYFHLFCVYTDKHKSGIVDRLVILFLSILGTTMPLLTAAFPFTTPPAGINILMSLCHCQYLAFSDFVYYCFDNSHPNIYKVIGHYHVPFDIRMLNCDITMLHCVITLMTMMLSTFSYTSRLFVFFLQKKSIYKFQNLVFGVAKSLVDVANIEY